MKVKKFLSSFTFVGYMLEPNTEKSGSFSENKGQILVARKPKRHTLLAILKNKERNFS
jgi:hypothetical protein